MSPGRQALFTRPASRKPVPAATLRCGRNRSNAGAIDTACLAPQGRYSQPTFLKRL